VVATAEENRLNTSLDELGRLKPSCPGGNPHGDRRLELLPPHFLSGIGKGVGGNHAQAADRGAADRMHDSNGLCCEA
jgi:hypothetical protein